MVREMVTKNFLATLSGSYFIRHFSLQPPKADYNAMSKVPESPALAIKSLILTFIHKNIEIFLN